MNIDSAGTITTENYAYYVSCKSSLGMFSLTGSIGRPIKTMEDIEELRAAIQKARPEHENVFVLGIIPIESAIE